MASFIAKSDGNFQWPNCMALIVLSVFGASSACFSQKAQAMSERQQPNLGEIQNESISGELHCEIMTRTVLESIELVGVVWANTSVIGNYSFVVTKQGSGGSSNVAQSGLFQVAPTERQIVGTVMLNTLSGDRYHARLSVRSGDDEVICDTRLE